MENDWLLLMLDNYGNRRRTPSVFPRIRIENSMQKWKRKQSLPFGFGREKTFPTNPPSFFFFLRHIGVHGRAVDHAGRFPEREKSEKKAGGERGRQASAGLSSNRINPFSSHPVCLSSPFLALGDAQPNPIPQGQSGREMGRGGGQKVSLSHCCVQTETDFCFELSSSLNCASLRSFLRSPASELTK